MIGKDLHFFVKCLPEVLVNEAALSRVGVPQDDHLRMSCPSSWYSRLHLNRAVDGESGADGVWLPDTQLVAPLHPWLRSLHPWPRSHRGSLETRSSLGERPARPYRVSLDDSLCVTLDILLEMSLLLLYSNTGIKLTEFTVEMVMIDKGSIKSSSLFNKLQQSWRMMLHENTEYFPVKFVIFIFPNTKSLTLYTLFLMPCTLCLIPNTLSHMPNAL